MWWVLFLTLLAPALAAGAPSPAAGLVAVPVAPWLSGYESLRLSLVADDAVGAAQAGRALVAATTADAELSLAAGRVADASTDVLRRVEFAALSRLVVLRLVADSDAPKVVAYHCGMTDGFAYWVQLQPGLGNPYMGVAMPACGEQVSLKAAAKAASS